ncbi:DMT family transporter [Allorhizobium sp. BGMRC 0089]|uniref:DMT family transporter n=1 Tax=Allorhizobium sonneratiae TaxID=2934936 RepID=UPI0020338C66|nr:DMT family transporter [Allorhizobium sonneratiae]MCM2294185.1 DMT family transporter [Allorhizobium sonneratiae]
MASPSSSPSAQMPLKTPLSGVSFGLMMMVLSVLVSPLIDVFSKLATETLPTLEIVTARFVFQILFALPVVMIRHSATRSSWRNTGLHVLRGAMVFLSMISFVAALRVMALADALAIFFVEPIILTVLSSIFLGETIGWRRYSACGVGFFGTLLVIQPSFQMFGVIALLPVVSAFAIAVFAILTRLLSRQQDAFVMQVNTGLAGLFFSCLLMLITFHTGSFTPVIPTTNAMLWLFGVGVTATMASTLGVFAYRSAPASLLAPLQYLEIVTGTLFSWLVFNALPDGLKWLGITIIIASGLYIIWRERKRASGPVSSAPDTPQP